MSAILSMLLFVGSCADNDIDLGVADQKDPPPAKSRVSPKSDEGVKKVGVRAPVVGTAPKAGKANVYVLVNPLSNPDTRDVWWVADTVTRDGDKLYGTAQFGESTAGLNEFFALVVVVTDEKFDVGEKMNGLPKGSAYSKLTIVKRTK